MKAKSKLFVLLGVGLSVTSMAFALSSCGGGGENPTTTSTTPVTETTTPTTGSGDTPVVTDVDGTIATPGSLRVDNVGKVTWGRVTGATGYQVDVNGTVKSVKIANLNLLDLTTLPKDGKFTIKVAAVKDNKTGKFSSPISYTYGGSKLISPEVCGMSGNNITWNNPSITSYPGIDKPVPVIKINGTATKLAENASSYDLSQVQAKSNLEIYFEGDGVYNKDSAKVKLVYEPTGKKLSYAAPQNVHMEGEILVFDKVEGANAYYVKDVNNTTTTLTSEEIVNLQSDRKGHFLVKEIWAGNTDLDISDSEPTEVTYFTTSDGLGTEASPFMITSASQLRYIEYYEVQNEAKYYKLANDLVFEEYTPADDEDYSNFYNLGNLSGVIDGDGHSLKNVTVYYKDGYSSIFDSITSTGQIKNLKIEDTKWRTWTNRTNDGVMHEKGGECSILAYQNRGTIDNVTLVSGSVVAVKDGASGLVSINRGTIKNCKALKTFTVEGANEAGAFAIYNAGTIQNSINYANVSGKRVIGGIVGRNAGLVKECGNEGEISADIYAGGIVGYNYNVKDGANMQYQTLVYSCYNKGKINCTAYAGGIAGKNGSDGYNEVDADAYANAGIYGCYNQGTVIGLISIAGIAGRNYGYNDVENNFGVRACYSSGGVNYGVTGFTTNRIYLSVADCSWAEAGDAKIYVHYWKPDNTGTNWPGVEMKKTTIGSSEFYYVDMGSIKANQLQGVKFNRVNPADGTVWNEFENDVKEVSRSDTAFYYVDSNWTTATMAEPSCGMIAGYNNMVNNCYYTEIKNTSTGIIIPGIAGGVIYDSSAKTITQLRDIAPTLNLALGNVEVFVTVENAFPKLKWQS